MFINFELSECGCSTKQCVKKLRAGVKSYFSKDKRKKGSHGEPDISNIQRY